LVARVALEPSIELETGVDVTGFARSETGVEAALRRGDETSRRAGDLLIGADGLRSSVRPRLGLGAGDDPLWSGRTAWRALVDGRRAPRHALRLETCVWLGRRAHLVHYPLRHGDLVNVVAVVEDGWRGGARDADLWSTSGDFSSIRRFFGRWHADARDVLDAAVEWRRWPLFERGLAPRWTDPRVALVGDAAHPMMPFLAQGAAQAVEDAEALAAALAAGGGVGAALARYEAIRMPRAAAVQSASRRQGAIFHLAGPAAWARDAVLEKTGFEKMMAQLDWLYRPEATAVGADTEALR
jgi:salicylate hydroxylase